jgi:hypothetical protein
MRDRRLAKCAKGKERVLNVRGQSQIPALLLLSLLTLDRLLVHCEPQSSCLGNGGYILCGRAVMRIKWQNGCLHFTVQDTEG